MQATPDIFSKVSDYLEHYITLEELEDWLVRNLGLLLSPPSKEAPDDASELAGTIELGLAEMSKGHRTEEEFRALVGEFIRSRDFILISPFEYPFEYQPNHTDSTFGPQIIEWDSRIPVEQWKRVEIELGTAS